MQPLCWTVIECGGAHQAVGLGRLAPGGALEPVAVLGAPRHVRLSAEAARREAEADGWASGLPCDRDYAPLTAPPPPRVMMTAVPEPVLVPAPWPLPPPLPPAPEPRPLPPPDPDAADEPEDADEPPPAPRPRAKPPLRRAPPPRKGR